MFGYGDLWLHSLFGEYSSYHFYHRCTQDAEIAGQMIGIKLAVNEFIDYLECVQYLQTDAV